MGVLIRPDERHPDAADGSVFSAAALLPRAGIVKGAAASPLNTFA